MRFTPKTEEEIETMGLLPEGQYAFEVFEAQEKTSRAGSDMIVLELRIYDQVGKPHFIIDYLLEALHYKLWHFCQVAELEMKYQEGNLTAELCMGKKGFVDIIVQKDETGKYRTKNSVKDYITKPELIPAASVKKDEFFDDQIPF